VASGGARRDESWADRQGAAVLPASSSLPSAADRGAARAQSPQNPGQFTLWEWGNNRFGQLGDGSTRDALTPLRLTEPPGVRFVKVDSGGATNYAIDSTGRLWSWGLDNVGQLGNRLHPLVQLKPISGGVTLTRVSSTAYEVAGFFDPQG